MLMGISHDVRYTGKSCDLLGGSLGVTARYNDLARPIFSPNAAEGGSCVLFGGGGNRAGIEYHPVSMGCLRRTVEPQPLKLLVNSGTVRLSGSATEIFYVKTGHRSILAYIHLRMGNCRTPLYV